MTGGTVPKLLRESAPGAPISDSIMDNNIIQETGSKAGSASPLTQDAGNAVSPQNNSNGSVHSAGMAGDSSVHVDRMSNASQHTVSLHGDPEEVNGPSPVPSVRIARGSATGDGGMATGTSLQVILNSPPLAAAPVAAAPVATVQVAAAAVAAAAGGPVERKAVSPPGDVLTPSSQMIRNEAKLHAVH